MITEERTIAIETARLDELREMPGNPRSHDRRNLRAITGSLEHFGQVEPLIVQASSGVIVGGNGRLAAMRQLGWNTCQVVRIRLTDDQTKALAVTLNRTAELAGWDVVRLEEIIAAMDSAGLPLPDLGWEPGDIETLGRPPDLDVGPSDPIDQDLPPEMGAVIRATIEQREIFDQAVYRVRTREDDARLSEGRCLELICADFLAGP